MKGLWNTGPIVDQANLAGTGGTITGVSGLAYDVAKWDIPIILLGTGSIGNNGALSGINALTTIYANCYVRVLAGAIATGVPAAEETYFCQMSSTTAGTIFNNTLSANLSSVGAPLIPASPTAFVTTGPGAFVGTTNAYIAVTIAVPAGAMGVNGMCLIDSDYQCVSAATNKIFTTTFGGTNIYGITQTTVVSVAARAQVKNRSSASSQRGQVSFGSSSSTTTPGSTYPAINTANAVNVGFQIQKNTVTESLVFEGGRVAVDPT